LGEMFFEFENVYNNSSTLQIVVGDKLVELMGDTKVIETLM